MKDEKIAFCRITELGFLRLLTNGRVMGEDVLNPTRAWQVYDGSRPDGQIIFLSEGAGFSRDWRQLGGQIMGGPNAWTDAYRATFAAHVNATVVTFDRRFGAIGDRGVHRLTA